MASGKLFGRDLAARLRRKFILVAMLAVGVVLTALIGGVNIANYLNIRVDADELIDLIAEYDGTIPMVFVGDSMVVVPDGTADPEDADGTSPDGSEEASGSEEGAGGTQTGEGDADSSALEGDAEGAEAAAGGAGDETSDADGSEGASDEEAASGESTDGTEDAADAADTDVDLILLDADTAFELFEEVHGRITAESTYDTRYFTVVVDAAGAAVTVDTTSIAAVDSDEAAQIAEELAAAGETEGFYSCYRYRAVSFEADSDDGSPSAEGQTMYIFVDCTAELESFETLLTTSVAMSAIGLVLVLILVIIFSYFTVMPIAESYEKQKRFITDASHEIKTPLSVIDAADEVVEIEYGESEWTQSIHEQVARLADLTNRLVFLSRMDEGAEGFSMEELSLTQVIEQAAEPYAAVARARGKELACEIESGLTCKGDSKALAQVVELLLDNALQYSSEGSCVQLAARRHGRRCQIVVQNECDQLPEGDLDRLFERFYRADSSRSSETGGSGVGLSVVRAIAEVHKGTVRAERVGEHAIRFVVEL